MEKEEISNFNEPICQLRLFGYDKYFQYLDSLNNKGSLPQVNLISGPRGYGKHTFIFHYLYYLLSIGKIEKYNLINKEIVEKNTTYKLMIDNIHPNFYFLDLKKGKKIIEIEQIREMSKYLQNTSFNRAVKYIVINNVGKLNLSSSNALLKTLEEPNANNYFFLIYDTSESLIKTIKSRCFELKINFTSSKKRDIISSLCSQHIQNFEESYLNKELDNLYMHSPGLIFDYIKFKYENEEIKNEDSKYILIDYFISKYTKSKETNFLKIIYFLAENFFYNKVKKNNSNLKLYTDRKIVLERLNLMINLNLDEKNVFHEIRTILANV